jgi:hypothetical protein
MPLIADCVSVSSGCSQIFPLEAKNGQVEGERCEGTTEGHC